MDLMEFLKRRVGIVEEAEEINSLVYYNFIKTKAYVLEFVCIPDEHIKRLGRLRRKVREKKKEIYARTYENFQDDKERKLHIISMNRRLEEVREAEAKFYKELERIDSFIKTNKNKYGKPANIERNEETEERMKEIKRREEEREKERKKEEGWKDEFKKFEEEKGINLSYIMPILF